MLNISNFIVCNAQQDYKVNIQCIDCNVDAFDFKVENKYDSLQVLNKINKAISDLRLENYLLANLDSIRFENQQCIAYIYQGEKYKVDKISFEEEDALIVNALGLDRLNLNEQGIDSTLFNKAMLQTIEYLMNNGYPFAQVGFEKPKVIEQVISAKLNIDKKQYISFDTLDLLNEPPISTNYLAQYLNIKEGTPYDHRKILSIENKIKETGFLKLDKSPWVSFINKKAIVRLPVKAKASNSFDFLIGVLPTTENGVRKFNVNGQLFLDLLNRFGSGERVTIDLQRLSEQDQFLSIAANYPYLLGLPIGVDASFDLRRNRDISIDLNTTFGGQYLLKGQDNVKGFGIYKSSNIINLDTSRLLNSGRLPDNLDYKYKGGGLALNKQNLDYRFNPTKGWKIITDFNLGLRSIIINQSLRGISSNELDFDNAYDTLSLNTFQANINLKADGYLPISKFGTVKFGLTSGWRYNNGIILENELYRIGGQRLLRGFDEQTIFTDLYAVISTEFRLLLDQNSYLSFPFIDVSRYRTYINSQPVWDTALGLGLGLNFATKAGIFNVSFAAGSRFNSPVDFNNTKVHFGFVSLF